MKPIIINPHKEAWPGKLAFEPGTFAVIPKGVKVRTMHPSRDEYVTARAQKVRVNHMLPGRFVSVREARNKYRAKLESEGFDLSCLDQWYSDNAPEYYRCMVQIEEPSVRWAGSGGYWCEVPVSAVEPVEQPLQERMKSDA